MELNLNKLQSTVLVSECFVRKTTSYAGNSDGECKIVLISSSKGNEKNYANSERKQRCPMQK